MLKSAWQSGSPRGEEDPDGREVFFFFLFKGAVWVTAQDKGKLTNGRLSFPVGEGWERPSYCSVSREEDNESISFLTRPVFQISLFLNKSICWSVCFGFGRQLCDLAERASPVRCTNAAEDTYNGHGNIGFFEHPIDERDGNGGPPLPQQLRSVGSPRTARSLRWYRGVRDCSSAVAGESGEIIGLRDVL